MEAREAEDQTAVREQDALEGLPQGAVQGDLVGQKPHVFDLVGQTRAHAGAHGVLGVGKLDFDDQVELRREHLARREHAEKVGVHQHVALLPGLHRLRPAAGVHGQALPVEFLPPRFRLQQ